MKEIDQYENPQGQPANVKADSEEEESEKSDKGDLPAQGKAEDSKPEQMVEEVKQGQADPKQADPKQPAEDSGKQGEKKKNKEKKFEKDSYAMIDDATWNQIKNNYGLVGDVFTSSNLMINVVGTKKRIRLISDGVKLFVQCDQKGWLNQVNLGTKAFERTKESF